MEKERNDKVLMGGNQVKKEGVNLGGGRRGMKRMRCV